MKLKFVAEAKDVLMFVMFAIFLLFVVALGVLNFPTLAGTGRLYGINPFPAFYPENITYTLVFYGVALFGLFMSVSSYFFETESGFGFSTSKKEKGYSRWAKPKEMKDTLKCVHPTDSKVDHAGVPLMCNGKELWIDDSEYHTLVIGATGSGKTQSTILPTVKILAKKGESLICTDPKGEIYEKTGTMLREKGYNIILLNFRNPQKGNAWNPLSLPYKLYTHDNKDKAIELLDDLALNILYEENSGNADPFWEKTSADYFSGLSLAMFDDTTEDKININSISLTTTVGEDKCGGSTYIKEYFTMKDPNSAAYINASGTIMAPSETKGSIIAVFKQKIKLFSSRENLSEMLSHSDFDIESIGKQKTAVFIIIQDEKKTYHSLATIFVKQCYETLIDVAQANGGKLPVRTNFLLDEFANMPPLKDVTTMITAARSRQIRFTLIIQNYAQLTQVYQKENAETIKGNCGNIIYLISTELAALEEISKLCGEVKSKKDDKTSSTPLVTVSDLQRMKQFDQIVLRMRQQPFKTSFVPDFKIDWGKTYPPATYPEREKNAVSVFDVREFVKEKKQQKIKDMMSDTFPNDGNSSTSSGGAFPPPFTPQANFGSSSSSDVSKKPPATPMPNFDVNDIVKKIDAKIAAIEQEEKEKKAGTSTSAVTGIGTEPKPSLLSANTAVNEEVAKPERSKLLPPEDNPSVVKPSLLSSNVVADEEYVRPERSKLLASEENTNVVKPSLLSNNTVVDEEYIRPERSKLLPPEETPAMARPSLLSTNTFADEEYVRPERSKLLPPEEPKEEIKPLISSADIESKVNDKLKSLFASNFEKPKDDEINLRPNIIQNNIEIEKPVFEEAPILKPTPTIKLSDVSDDDKFFDDFFDD